MEHIDVTWIHDNAVDPVRLVSEIDADRYEIRKLEFFRDGRVGFASRRERTPGTALGGVPVPPLAIINQSSEFEGVAMDAMAFERLWLAHASGCV